MRIPVSVVVLTFNEETNIGQCLASVAWCDDILVVDSYSTDHTCELAERAGARVMLREFDGYASQRNYALKEVSHRHPWVLMLDADEVVSPALATEIAQALAGDDGRMTLYLMRRRDYFMGTWLKHCTNYRSLWFGRLMRPDRVWVEREVNEEYHTEGQVGSLREALLHYPFSKGTSAWIDKHNRYSTMEAELLASGPRARWSLGDLSAADRVRRRRALKAIVYSLPARALVMFIGRYVLSAGFLDGRAGLTFCLLKSWYEFLIDCKVHEIHRRQRGGAV